MRIFYFKMATSEGGGVCISSVEKQPQFWVVQVIWNQTEFGSPRPTSKRAVFNFMVQIVEKRSETDGKRKKNEKKRIRFFLVIIDLFCSPVSSVLGHFLGIWVRKRCTMFWSEFLCLWVIFWVILSFWVIVDFVFYSG